MLQVRSSLSRLKLGVVTSIASGWATEELATRFSDVLSARVIESIESNEIKLDDNSQTYYRPTGTNVPHTKHSIVYQFYYSSSKEDLAFILELAERLKMLEQTGTQKQLYKDQDNKVKTILQPYTYFQDGDYFVKIYDLTVASGDKQILLSLELQSEPHEAYLNQYESSASVSARKSQFRKDTYGDRPQSNGAKFANSKNGVEAQPFA